MAAAVGGRGRGVGGGPPAPPPHPRPPLLLLSSLPILFADDFALEAPDSPLRDALQSRFALRPIALADATSLDGAGLLLMAQPRAQTAEALVDLDAWVRGGGHLLLLADPLLQWPTDRPLGDPLAPVPAYADTGLLGHWGLTLYRPEPGSSLGSFAASKQSGCTLEEDAVVARCTIGKGRVTIIADADFARDGPGAARLVGELEKLSAR